MKHLVFIFLILCACEKESTPLSAQSVKRDENIMELVNMKIEKHYNYRGLHEKTMVYITPNWGYVTPEGNLYYTPELPLGTSEIDAAQYGATSLYTIRKVERVVGEAIRRYNAGEWKKELSSL